MTYTHLSSKQRFQIQGLTKAGMHLSSIALWWRTQVHASTRALATVGTPYVAPAPDQMPDQLRGGEGQQVLRRLTAVGQCVLVISPHGLDVALGCGGAMARHADAGDGVHPLVLFGDGSGREAARRSNAAAAAAILGSGPPWNSSLMAVTYRRPTQSVSQGPCWVLLSCPEIMCLEQEIAL